MTRRLSITSNANPRLKTIRQLSRGRRRAVPMFLVEGHRQLRCALEAHAPVREVFAAPDLFMGELDAELVALAERRGARVYELGRGAFCGISRQVRPDGLAAVVDRWSTALAGLSVPGDGLLLVAEGTERPGNLGAMIRTACAAGAAGVVAVDAVTDVFHPETVRGSAGTLFRIQLATAGTAATISWLRERGISITVTSPAARRPYWEAAAGGATAVVVGGERYGISRAWLEAADEVVCVPMPGPADSLNVAVAAGVVLFDQARRAVRSA